ncbi:hypothetical protein [Nocardiopsis sp. ATB16-24]|uniref:hypothetical protein n=1 Tax=Nocardiopsis sp. ATB16-24 TaxID=3019555 RepID=UPI0025570FF4|nr:hypothetical protein [Nocardiopsis sp. ATB16-24]
MSEYTVKIKRLFTLLISATVILTLTTTGMSAASSSPKNSDLAILGSSNGTNDLSRQLVAEVNEAYRNQQGNLLSVTWGIYNTGDNHVVLSWLNQYSYVYSGPNFAGVTAFDPKEGKRFHPVMDGENYCLCSGEYSVQLQETAVPRSTVTYWSMYSVPEDLESITIEIPGFDPIEDIPIS